MWIRFRDFGPENCILPVMYFNYSVTLMGREGGREGGGLSHDFVNKRAHYSKLYLWLLS